jgi:hypothetical protein
LNVRGIDRTQWPTQAKLLTMLVQPIPNRVVGKAVGTYNVDGTPVAISPSCRTTAVEGIVRSCLKSDSQNLSVVVAKSAQYRPIDAGGI